MAKILIFDRDAQQPQTLNTGTSEVSSLGAAIGVADISGQFDARSQNLVAVFRGDPYILLRTAANQARVYRYSGGVWNLVHTQSATSGGVLQCFGLHVVNDTLAAIIIENNVAGRVHHAKTDDGTTWSTAFSTIGVIGTASHSIVYKQSVWFATEEGLLFWDTALATIFGTIMDGDDSGLAAPEACGGCFASWDGNLYFLMPDTGSGPQLYMLDPAWDKTVGTGVRWFNQSAIDLPDPGGFTAALGGGHYCLFVNRMDELCASYAGPNGTFIAKTTNATFPTFTDVTINVFPASIIALTAARVALYEDDRRRSNKLQFLIVTDPATTDSTVLQWGGDGMVTVKQTVTGQTLLVPSEAKADYRTFTNQEPAVYFPVGAFSQPFPGQVRLDYFLIDTAGRMCDLSAEYSLDGDEWFPMTGGEGGDGDTALGSSVSPGTAHTFIWDAYVDIDDDNPNVQMRLVPRISGV